jgi:hypothetical protein
MSIQELIYCSQKKHSELACRYIHLANHGLDTKCVREKLDRIEYLQTLISIKSGIESDCISDENYNKFILLQKNHYFCSQDDNKIGEADDLSSLITEEEYNEAVTELTRLVKS